MPDLGCGYYFSKMAGALPTVPSQRGYKNYAAENRRILSGSLSATVR